MSFGHSSKVTPETKYFQQLLEKQRIATQVHRNNDYPCNCSKIGMYLTHQSSRIAYSDCRTRIFAPSQKFSHDKKIPCISSFIQRVNLRINLLLYSHSFSFSYGCNYLKKKCNHCGHDYFFIFIFFIQETFTISKNNFRPKVTKCGF